MCKHIVYCISFAKNRAIFCGNSVWKFPNINGRGTRIKKIMTTPMAAMMRPINRPLGLFLWCCCFVAILAHVTQRIHGTI